VCSSSVGVPLGAYSHPSAPVVNLPIAFVRPRQYALSGTFPVERFASSDGPLSAPSLFRDPLDLAPAQESRADAVSTNISPRSHFQGTLAVGPMFGAPRTELEGKLVRSGEPLRAVLAAEELTLPVSALSEVEQLLENESARDELLPIGTPDDLVVEPDLEINPDSDPLQGSHLPSKNEWNSILRNTVPRPSLVKKRRAGRPNETLDK
jgi:hypothetical protein